MKLDIHLFLLKAFLFSMAAQARIRGVKSFRTESYRAKSVQRQCHSFPEYQTADPHSSEEYCLAPPFHQR